MFFAIIYYRHFNLDTETTVVFDTIVINEGNRNNNYDRVFVAPRNGIYLFSQTVSSSDVNRLMSELVVDDEVITSTGERDMIIVELYVSFNDSDMKNDKRKSSLDKNNWLLVYNHSLKS